MFDQALFSERFESALKRRSMTQAALARYIGVSHQAVSQYINGRSNPNFDVLYNISVVLGTSLDYLFGLSDIDGIVDRDIDAFIADTIGLSSGTVQVLRIHQLWEKEQQKATEPRKNWSSKTMLDHLREDSQKG